MSTDLNPEESPMEMPDPEVETGKKAENRDRLKKQKRMKAMGYGLAATVAAIASVKAYDAVHTELTVRGIIGVSQAIVAMDADLKLDEMSLLSRSGHIMAEHAYGVEAGLTEMGATLRPSLRSDLDDMRGERNDTIAGILEPVFQMGYQQALAGEWSEEGLNQLVEGTLFVSYAENAALAPDGANGSNATSPIALMNQQVLEEVTATASSIQRHFGHTDIQHIDQVDENLRQHLVVSAHYEMRFLSEKIEEIVGGFDPADLGSNADMTVGYEPPSPD